jgi:hypothetical protein
MLVTCLQNDTASQPVRPEWEHNCTRGFGAVLFQCRIQWCEPRLIKCKMYDTMQMVTVYQENSARICKERVNSSSHLHNNQYRLRDVISVCMYVCILVHIRISDDVRRSNIALSPLTQCYCQYHYIFMIRVWRVASSFPAGALG